MKHKFKFWNDVIYPILAKIVGKKYGCGEDMPKSPSQDCMKRGKQVCEWIMQGMKEAEKWIKENGKNPYADILLEKEGDEK